ncbi:PDZ domain-containing protein [Tundrisphaera sp. TA3]|uniref:PDZ domain-containing protein n=1 Tax=Tundrisphaera sp. TA3 TaxID=3435775 RepID=UPI003EB9E809
MTFHLIRSTIVAGLILASASWTAPARGEGHHATALERYGLGGRIQAIGVHHGFHIETVAAGSPADEDQLRAHDVIVMVDGDVIRSLDHLRAVLAEAYMGDGDVTLTYTRGTSLTHRVLKPHLKPSVTPVARRARPDGERDEPSRDADRVGSRRDADRANPR